MERYWKIVFGLLLLTASMVWISVLVVPDKTFKLIACDVGQGDAILAVYGANQILTDGGPGSSVISCLEKYMPFYDRKIELVVLTHADRDHYGGLVHVFKRYEVNTLVVSSVDSGSSGYEVLKNAVGGSATRVIYPEEGITVRLGKMHLDIVYPNDLALREEYSQVLGASVLEGKTNENSIVTLLSFGDFDALLTGDIGPNENDMVADRILNKYASKTLEYIKVPHHGSKNGLTIKLLDAVKPKLAVISSGKGNSYGHPHAEIVDMLTKHRVQILRTDELGEIVLESDGRRVWLSN